MLEGIGYDLRFAFRGLRRAPSFTITAIATLAMAIGLNVTVFTVMNAMLYRGFPLVKRNDRLVYIQEKSRLTCCGVSYAHFEGWRLHARSFQESSYISGKPITLRDTLSNHGGPVEHMGAPLVGTNVFHLLGVQPVIGRDFAPADGFPGAPPVAILGYSFWERRFGKRPDIVGHAVRIDDQMTTIIGVMPEDFGFTEHSNLWLPVNPAGEKSRNTWGYLVVGRMANSATVASARTELETLNRRLASTDSAIDRDAKPVLKNYSEFFIGPDAKVIYGSMWMATLFVVAIACANLANLTLARTVGRSREFSTRIALGAGRWRMIRQLLTESAMVVAVGGALGWWVAQWSVRIFEAATATRYRVLDYTMDFSTLAYLAGVSLAAAILTGIVPVSRVVQMDMNQMLKGGARGVTQGRKGKFLSAALIAGQMTLAIVLLAGAGVLVRSFHAIVSAETGVKEPENILNGFVSVPENRYASTEARNKFYDLLKARLESIPGVEAEAMGSARPTLYTRKYVFEMEPGIGTEALFNLRISSQYFHVLGASIVAGRDFNAGDKPGSLPVAIVNQIFASTFWPGQNPIGKRIRQVDAGKSGEWRTVVGVATNIMQGDATRQHFQPVVYMPFRQDPTNDAGFFVRTRLPGDQVAAPVRAELQKIEPDLDLEEFVTLKEGMGFRSDRMDVEHQDAGKNAALSPIFATIALLLAATGLYAVIAHSVSQRTKEIGIRMAIGAAANDIQRMVFREGMLPVMIGLLIGLVASLGVNRVLQSQLVAVSPYDPVTLATAPVMLILVALLGCQIPARRAMHVDPAIALRHD